MGAFKDTLPIVCNGFKVTCGCLGNRLNMRKGRSVVCTAIEAFYIRHNINVLWGNCPFKRDVLLCQYHFAEFEE